MGLFSMTTRHWSILSLVLFLALIASVLLLPPWSPVSLTSESTSDVQPDEVISAPTTGVVEGGADVVKTSEDQQDITTETPSDISSASQEGALELESTPAVPTRQAKVDSADATRTAPNPTADSTEGPSEETASPSSLSLDELIVATEDVNWKVRWDAVNELGTRRDPLGIPALVNRALVDDNSHPRWRSLWALGLVDRSGTEAIPLLLAGLEHTDPLVVRNAAVALASFGQAEARAELIRGLNDPDTYRRWEAVFSLKSIGDPEVANALITVLNGKVEAVTRVRQEAALTLGRIGGEGVAPALFTALQDDPSPDVRWRAAAALSRLGDASVISDLEVVLATEEDPKVRENIEGAITRLQGR